MAGNVAQEFAVSSTPEHFSLPEGEHAVVAALIFIPIIWTVLIMPMVTQERCLSKLVIAMMLAALIGAAIAALREYMLVRQFRASANPNQK